MSPGPGPSSFSSGAERPGQSERVRLDEGTLEKLEALGYVEGDATPDPDEGREETDGP